MKRKIVIIQIILFILVTIIVINKVSTPKKQLEVQNSTYDALPSTNSSLAVKTTKKVVKTTKKTTKKITTTRKVNNTKQKTTTKTISKQNGYKLTHYGHDCKGCGGTTSIGYNVKNTIYYNDKQYGKVRVCAMNKSMPLYSIIKIKNYKLGGDITCAVIDRGVGSGVIDLLVENEKKSSQLGIQKGVQIEILRKGK